MNDAFAALLFTDQIDGMTVHYAVSQKGMDLWFPVFDFSPILGVWF